MDSIIEKKNPVVDEKNIITYENQLAKFNRNAATVFNGVNRNQPFLNNGNASSTYNNFNFFYTPFRIYDEISYLQAYRHYWWAFGYHGKKCDGASHCKDYYSTGKTDEIKIREYERNFASGGDYFSTSKSGILRGFEINVWKDNFDQKVLFRDSRVGTGGKLDKGCYIDVSNVASGNVPHLRNESYFMNYDFKNYGLNFRLFPFERNLTSNFKRLNELPKLTINYWAYTNLGKQPSSQEYTVQQDPDKMVAIEKQRYKFMAVSNNGEYDFLNKTSDTLERFRFQKEDYNKNGLLYNSTQDSYVSWADTNGITAFQEPIVASSLTSMKCEETLVSFAPQIPALKDEKFELNVENTQPIYDVFKAKYEIKDVFIYPNEFPNYYAEIAEEINDIFPIIENINVAMNEDFVVGINDMNEEQVEQAKAFLVEKINEIFDSILNGDSFEKVVSKVKSAFVSDNKIYDFWINSIFLPRLLKEVGVGFTPKDLKFIPDGYACDGSTVDEDISSNITFDKLLDPKYGNAAFSQVQGFIPRNADKTSLTLNNVVSVPAGNKYDYLKPTLKREKIEVVKNTEILASRQAAKEKEPSNYKTQKIGFIYKVPVKPKINLSEVSLYKDFYLNGVERSVNANPCCFECGNVGFNIASMAVFYYPYVQLNFDKIRENIRVEITKYIRNFNSKYLNYKLLDKDIEIEIKFMDKNVSNFSNETPFIFNRGFSTSTIPINLVQQCDVETGTLCRTQII